MRKKVLIIENASTLAMRLKLLIELQNCEVEMVHESYFVLADYQRYFDMIVVEYSASAELIKQLKQQHCFCPYLILAPAMENLGSTTELTTVQQQLPNNSIIYEFYTNKEILSELEALLGLSMQGDETPLPQILLVDDNEKRLNAIERELVDANLNVSCILNPVSLATELEALETVDILVSDFHMPSLTGIDVFREVKRKFKECQCILLTSRTHHSVLIEVIREGVSEVLEKPIDQNVLLQAIHKLWQTQTLKRTNQNLITRWQETLDILVEHDILLRVLFNSTLDGVMVVDESGEILETNPACDQLLGFDKEQIKQVPIEQLMTRRSRVKLARILRDKVMSQRFSIEMYAKVRDRGTVPLYVSFSKINYHGRKVYAGTLRDISKLVDQREQLRKQKSLLEAKVRQRTEALENAKNVAEQANNSKSEFLANMSHELRTPMHSILSFSRFGLDMLSGDKINREKLTKYYQRIVTSGNQLLRLLNNLLDLSKLAAGKFPFNPRESSIRGAISHVIQEVSTLALEKGIQIRTNNDHSTDMIWCDDALVQQIVRNLLGNAIRFSPENAEVWVGVADGKIWGESGPVDAVEITVSDSGVGIPESELKTIFNQFAQSSKTNKGAGGTGLGLAICKDLVELHHGEIFAANNANAGAVFTFKLPLCKQN